MDESCWDWFINSWILVNRMFKNKSRHDPSLALDGGWLPSSLLWFSSIILRNDSYLEKPSKKIAISFSCRIKVITRHPFLPVNPLIPFPVTGSRPGENCASCYPLLGAHQHVQLYHVSYSFGFSISNLKVAKYPFIKKINFKRRLWSFISWACIC